ncbi:MAG: thiopurine S-methyltransferase [Tunicatimonas sp.]
MNADFWQRRWETNDIGFHRPEAHPWLVAHLNQLSLEPQSRLFLPLCGKSRDIAWLLHQGFRVVGVELSQRAIEQLFAELNVAPTITPVKNLMHYQAESLDVFVGDLFDVSDEILGPVDAIYDRAALVALPDAMRRRYAAHLTEITRRASQLLITFEYDQQCLEGPPFSVDEAEVDRHYGESYQVIPIAQTNVRGGLKGKCAATERAWCLRQ